MNVKSMLVGFLIAVVASTGTYFLVPPPTGAEASSCATKEDVENAVERESNATRMNVDITNQLIHDYVGGDLFRHHNEIDFDVSDIKGFVLGLREALIDAEVISNKAKLYLHEEDATNNKRG